MALAVRFAQTGNPREVVTVEEVETPKPAAAQVVVRVLAVPVNPADLNFIEGRYGKKPDLPATPGTEGVGVVEEVGSEVQDVRVGDRVILPAGVGSWRQTCVVDANRVIGVPDSIDIHQAAMLRVNPATAYCMLHQFVRLKPGGWVAQNAANSAVGRCVIQIAKKSGWRTVNAVRRPELLEELNSLGGDHAILDKRESYKEVKELVDGAPIALGLNAVGGDSALGIASTLANGATHVTYGAMSMQALKIPNSFLIFKDLRFVGFWVTSWLDSATAAERRSVFEDLIQMVLGGELVIPVAAVYPLQKIEEAVRHAQQDKRDGKVLIQIS